MITAAQADALVAEEKVIEEDLRWSFQRGGMRFAARVRSLEPDAELTIRVGDPDPELFDCLRLFNISLRGLGRPLFAELQCQLAARNLTLQRGRAAIDASLVEAQASRKRIGSAQDPSDPDAAFTRHTGKAVTATRCTSTWAWTRC